MKRILIWTVCLLIGVAYSASKLPESEQKPAHFHVDLKIYINNKKVDLGDTKYQSTDDHKKDQYIHMHDGNGDVVHFHSTGMNLHNMFVALGGNLTPNCLYLENQRLCTGFLSSLKVYVNGKRQLLPHRYEPSDGDKILVSFGPHIDSNTEPQLASLTDDACIYSLKCPERGEPPTENCIGNSTDPCVLPGTE